MSKSKFDQHQDAYTLNWCCFIANIRTPAMSRPLCCVISGQRHEHSRKRTPTQISPEKRFYMFSQTIVGTRYLFTFKSLNALLNWASLCRNKQITKAIPWIKPQNRCETSSIDEVYCFDFWIVKTLVCSRCPNAKCNFIITAECLFRGNVPFRLCRSAIPF